MPQLARITSTFFTNLITRLGIRPPFSEGFEISNVVQPVSLVDSDITLQSVVSSILMGTAFSNGITATPAANTVLADTGAQTAGNYAVRIHYGADFSAASSTNAYQIQRRDSANATNIWTILGSIPIGSPILFETASITLAANERLRIIQSTACTSGNVQASIWIVPIA